MNAGSAIHYCDRRKEIAVCSARSEPTSVRLCKPNRVAAADNNGAAWQQTTMSNNTLNPNHPKAHAFVFAPCEQSGLTVRPGI
jgi:hypothetical protein